MRNKAIAAYISPSRKTSHQIVKKAPLFISMFLTMFIIVCSLSFSIPKAVADDDGSGVLQTAASGDASKGDPGAGSGQDGFFTAVANAFGTKQVASDWSKVMVRLFSTQYMNKVGPNAVGAGSFPNGDEINQDINGKPGYGCSTKSKGVGTIVYHNCDIPNIVTDFLQNVIALVTPTGVQGASIQSSVVPLGFGLPSTIPGGEVPVDSTKRTLKYTALELFGYNLRYTSYAGEWDHINVMTSARALSNFGSLDYLELGVKTIINGITQGLNSGVNGAIDGWNNGGPIGAIWGGISGFFSGQAAGTVTNVLDTSDLNVMNTYGWTRSGLNGTIYNGRQMTQQEIQDLLLNKLKIYLNNKAPANTKPPADFTAIQNAPPRPTDAISQCKIVVGGKAQVILDSPTPPGPTKAQCQAQVDKTSGATMQWSVDGKQKGQTLAQWKTANAAFFNAASKYKVSCTIDTTKESDRTNQLAQFYSCWPSAWQNATAGVLKNQQTSDAQQWINDAFQNDAINAFFADPANNPNGPWNQFICTNATGQDILQANGLPQTTYNSSGKLNPKCKAIRPPIQNGYFGSGYIASGPNQNPGVDTRYAMVDKFSLLSFFFNQRSFGTSIGNLGLSVSQFITKFSNTALDFSFSPILDKIGVKNVVINLIKAFRESVFMPLIALMIAFSALVLLIRTGRSGQYMQGLTGIILILATFVIGIFTMMYPDKLMKVVDDGPAYVETAIVGTIFGFGQDQDDLCSATQASAGTLTGINGEALPFNPKSSVRTMTCEVWKVWVFTPWVGGQWGTSYENLYASTTNQPSKLKNTDTALVGTADVNMGSGVVIHNWALYQVQAMSSGTATNQDLSNPTGANSKDIYRVVDAMAGPNNGAGRDGRFLANWSGQSPVSRILIAGISIPSSILGLVAILMFAVGKIIVTFASIILLLLLPFMLLIGVHPTFGRVQLRGYVGSILSLMYQRIILVTLLAIMMRIMISFSSNTSPLFSAIITMIISLLFILNHKKFMQLAHVNTAQKFGQHFTSAFAGNDRNNAFTSMLPRGIQNEINMRRSSMQGAVGGAVGGFIAGGTEGAREGIQHQRAEMELRAMKQNRRGGLGTKEAIAGAADAASSSVASNMKTRAAKTTQYQETAAMDITQEGLRRVSNNSPGSKDRVVVEKFDLNGKNREKNEDYQKMLDIQLKIDKIRANAGKTNKAPDTDFDSSTASVLNKLNNTNRLPEIKEREIQTLQKEYDQLRDKLATDFYSRETGEKSPYKKNKAEELERLRIETENAQRIANGEAPSTTYVDSNGYVNYETVIKRRRETQGDDDE